MKLDSILAKLHSAQKIGSGNPVVQSVENDHRNVQAGSLFICIKGYTVDGHDFAEQAIAAGAVALIAEHPLPVSVPVIVVPSSERTMAIIANIFYEFPTRSLALVGITGTNGKTTTSQILDEILQTFGQTTGVIGTLHTKINQQIQQTNNTTPDSLTLQKIFHQMKNEQVNTAIMEVSSHSLEIGRVHGCAYDIAVFTNLTSDHLDFHKTMDNYRFAKSLLFSQLGSELDQKIAILNSDEEAAAFFQRCTQAQVFTYGIHHKADFQARDIIQTVKDTRFVVDSPIGSFQIRSKFVGQFNVYNVLAVFATCYALGLNLEMVASALASVSGVDGRFETVDAGQDFTVIVDYAHTPDSLENVLKTINNLTDRQVITVVGCGGDRDRTKRPLMAQIACEWSTKAIFTADNPRTESQEIIFEDMKSGVSHRTYQLIENRAEAIENAIQQAKQGDVVLIAGKGHETYQIFGTEKTPFDDREIAYTAMLHHLKND